MTPVKLLVVMVLIWVVFLAWYVGTLRGRRECRASHRLDTHPGGPSTDLATCWAIWPDASKHLPREWS